MDIETIREKITRRRRQILVHSVIYYRYNENLISDMTWSQWACELEELQNLYPEIAAELPLAKEFEGFDHSTGADLPLGNSWANGVARMLLNLSVTGGTNDS